MRLIWFDQPARSLLQPPDRITSTVNTKPHSYSVPAPWLQLSHHQILKIKSAALLLLFIFSRFYFCRSTVSWHFMQHEINSTFVWLTITFVCLFHSRPLSHFSSTLISSAECTSSRIYYTVNDSSPVCYI